MSVIFVADSFEPADKAKLQSYIQPESDWFTERHNEIVFRARNQIILVLGDHPEIPSEENVFTKVIKKIREEKHHAVIPLREVSRQGNHLHSEKLAIRHYPVVIKLDMSDSINPPETGSVGENVLIAFDKKCQEKTFLFLKDTENNRKMVYSIEHYCLYFPRTYFCKDEADMVEQAANISVREAYRIAYLHHEDDLRHKDDGVLNRQGV